VEAVYVVANCLPTVAETCLCCIVSGEVRAVVDFARAVADGAGVGGSLVGGGSAVGGATVDVGSGAGGYVGKGAGHFVQFYYKDRCAPSAANSGAATNLTRLVA
jgi:hypothetical protein